MSRLVPCLVDCKIKGHKIVFRFFFEICGQPNGLVDFDMWNEILKVNMDDYYTSSLMTELRYRISGGSLSEVPN